MNKILTLGFLVALLLSVYAYFAYNDAYSGLSLVIVMSALSSLIIIFMQECDMDSNIHFPI